MVPVNGLWLGSSLSRLEKLSILSFLRKGHPYRLWCYEPVEGIPAGVEVRDANEILPQSRVFYCHKFGPRQQVQGFSDLFRYKLLHDHGGWWADLDITLLEQLPVAEYSLAKHIHLGLVGNVMCAPIGCPRMAESVELCTKSVGPDSTDWLLPVRLMLNVLKRERVEITITDFGSDDYWGAIHPLISDPSVQLPLWDGIHWCNSLWTLDRNKPVPGTVYDQLLRSYGL